MTDYGILYKDATNHWNVTDKDSYFSPAQDSTNKWTLEFAYSPTDAIATAHVLMRGKRYKHIFVDIAYIVDHLQWLDDQVNTLANEIRVMHQEQCSRDELRKCTPEVAAHRLGYLNALTVLYERLSPDELSARHWRRRYEGLAYLYNNNNRR